MSDPAPGERLLSMWRRLRPLPGGRWLFGVLLGRIVPYSGTTHPRVIELAPGVARIAMHDRRGVRNHLDSIHAIALANLGELASGLAMIAALPAGVRSIVTGLTVEYVKKARGGVLAESRVALPAITAEQELDVRAEIRDGSGELVARVTARWRLAPRSAS